MSRAAFIENVAKTGNISKAESKRIVDLMLGRSGLERRRNSSSGTPVAANRSNRPTGFGGTGSRDERGPPARRTAKAPGAVQTSRDRLPNCKSARLPQGVGSTPVGRNPLLRP